MERGKELMFVVRGFFLIKRGGSYNVVFVYILVLRVSYMFVITIEVEGRGVLGG